MDLFRDLSKMVPVFNFRDFKIEIWGESQILADFATEGETFFVRRDIRDRFCQKIIIHSKQTKLGNIVL